MKKIIIAIMLLWLLPVNLFAQTLQGTVTDAISGEPLMGDSIPTLAITTGSNLRIRESIFWTPRPTILKANALSTTGVPCCRSTLDFEMNRR